MPNTPSNGAIYNDILLCRNGSYPALGDKAYPTHTSLSTSTHHAIHGNVLWWNTTTHQQQHHHNRIRENGSIRLLRIIQTNITICVLHLRTGAFIDKRTTPALDFYGNGPGTLSNVVAYGRVYSGAYQVYAATTWQRQSTVDIRQRWSTGNTTYSGFEVPGPYQLSSTRWATFIYTVTSEHTFKHQSIKEH